MIRAETTLIILGKIHFLLISENVFFVQDVISNNVTSFMESKLKLIDSATNSSRSPCPRKLCNLSDLTEKCR